jgi:hypothetical protein
VTISNTNHTADPSSKVKLDYAGKLKNMWDHTTNPSPKVKLALES